MKNKIGSLQLSGLMIGPILGSGIILLPPLAYKALGNASIWAWVAIMFLGALFAIMFSKIAVIYPGEAGMTIAVEKVFGKKMKLYASFLMICAVTFGPSAVLLTASEYLHQLSFLKAVPIPVIAIVLTLLALIILMKELRFISSMSFVLSTIIVIVLGVCSASILFTNPIQVASVSSIDVVPFGQVVLLLFWAIIGWEIIGNYSTQVRDLKKTLPKAMTISLVVITLSYILLSLAFQSFGHVENLNLVHVLSPVFGDFSSVVLALLITGLCLCTYLLIVGALGRLLASLASEGYIFSFYSKRNKNDIPINGILYFSIVHIILLVLTMLNILDIEKIVSIANTFFLANALIGILACIKIVDGFLFKASGILLVIGLFALLTFSSLKLILALIIVYMIARKVSTKPVEENITTSLKQDA